MSNRIRVASIPINKCRHYCGFKYGCQSLNPYEEYITGLHQQKAISQLRNNFEYFLMHYRPQSFGDIFGLELSNNIPFWLYPWSGAIDISPNYGWMEDIDDIIDIITHFCEKGIKRTQVEQEYLWLEEAYETISKFGYQPSKYSYIEVMELKRKDESVFIVKDGNHRLSSLSALGHLEIKAKIYVSEQVRAEDCHNWKQVLSGRYTEVEALAIFNSYFTGIDNFIPSKKPALILANM
jgi:hypothetical protein